MGLSASEVIASVRLCRRWSVSKSRKLQLLSFGVDAVICDITRDAGAHGRLPLAQRAVPNRLAFNLGSDHVDADRSSRDGVGSFPRSTATASTSILVGCAEMS